ncbi:hypothetical protein HO173_012806 [Letharia columbiana]|uniref:Uncharacterized protein n=1 Tax=Letharia columbiana TaxID=112416 RepID=A0A8H6FEP5_9LECA|nr:uncharacterized protein HO173_012806 [Letharia columbiana]KAF6225321.1 hypothetical protein HO173_012806 [Letharia columbiana]
MRPTAVLLASDMADERLGQLTKGHTREGEVKPVVSNKGNWTEYESSCFDQTSIIASGGMFDLLPKTDIRMMVFGASDCHFFDSLPGVNV